MINFRVWLEATSRERRLKSAESSHMYAVHVIKGRWPEGEPVIAKDPEWAYRYARDVIRGRWPEAEAVIAKDPKYAWRYARDLIKGRWPEAEAVIAKDPRAALDYANEVIKGRWPEGEATMRKDPRFWGYYMNFIGFLSIKVSSFPEFLEHPDVIGLSEAWPLLRRVIQGSPKALRTFYMDYAPEHIRKLMMR